MNSVQISATTYTTTVAGNGPSIGECVEVQGVNGRQVFMWSKNVGATTTAIGDWMGAATSGTVGEVSRTAATTIVNTVSTGAPCVGVAQAATATNGFLWVQISGPGAVAATTDGNVVAGDPLTIDGAGTPVGIVNRMADGEEENLAGWAFAADGGAGGTVQAALSYLIRSIYT